MIMESITIYLTILNIFLVFSFSIYILFDKKKSKSNLAKKKLTIFTFLVLVVLFVIYEYTDITLKHEVEKVKFSSKAVETDDSLLMTNEGRKEIEDSLIMLKKQLFGLQQQIKRKSVLLGNTDKMHNEVQKSIKVADADIEKVKSYNEIYPPSFYDRKYKGVRYSHETTSLILYPPKDLNVDFLDFSFIFLNDKIVSSIATIYVEVYVLHPDGNRLCLFNEYYKPQKGINKFRIKNLLHQKNVEMSVGYFWKSEFGKQDYLNYEHVTFRL